MPSASLEGSITLTTYDNYISAWSFALEREYGSGPTAIAAFQESQRELAPFSRLQGGVRCSKELSSSFWRGQLTLLAMRRLPLDDFPDLAATANLWLPVQAYYAVHAMGIAAFVALGHQVPRNHRAFCAAFSQTVCRLLPRPFGAVCSGGPQPKGFTFTGIIASSDMVAAQSNLANPKYSGGDAFLGKSLSTTRAKLLDESFERARTENIRPNRSRRNLPLEERRKLAQNLHKTSIADLHYRMRRRANYDDPDMYFAAFSDSQGVVTHYRALARVSDFLAVGLCGIIRRKIGGKAMDQLEARLA